MIKDFSDTRSTPGDGIFMCFLEAVFERKKKNDTFHSLIHNFEEIDFLNNYNKILKTY